MTLNLLDQESRDYAIRTLFGEAGSDPASQHGVAAVIKNRATQSGKPVKDVVTAKSQFEPWGTEAGRKRLLALDPNSEEYKSLGTVIDSIWSGATEDPTHGATMFYAPDAQAKAGREAPSWAKGPGITLGAHQFYGGAFPEPKAGEEVAMATPTATPGVSEVTPTVITPVTGSPPKITNPLSGSATLKSPLPSEEAGSPTPSTSLFKPGEDQESILKQFQSAGMTPQQLAMVAKMMQMMV